MKTLTKEQFEKKYGTSALEQFPSPIQKRGRFDDAISDIFGIVQNTNEDLKKRGENISESFKAGERGEQTPIETGFQAGSQVVLGLGDAAFNAAKGVASVPLAEDEEQFIGEKIGEAASATGIPQFVDALPERQKRNLGVVASFLEVAGLKGGSHVARKSLGEADNILKESKRINPFKEGVAIPDLSNVVKDVRFNLSDIDPKVETALKRSDLNEVNTYFQQAKNAASDTRKPTPLEIAGGKAEQAYDTIDGAIANAGKGKRRLLDEVGENKISPELVTEIKTTATQRLSEQYGVEIQSNGVIKDVSGRFSKLDKPDQKLVTDYFQRLNSLGESPSLREVDDFVDWAQSQLYKQSKTLSLLEAADSSVVKSLQGVTGELNARLKDQVGNGYGEVNARLSNLIELRDELSRALGADARKGGGVMKRLFSPTGGQTRQMFEQIRNETGIDLDKEANLARFAMDSVGDARQKSLLQELNAQFDTAAELDITKPLSIIKYIRERADLDDQELANEIIKRANAENVPTSKASNQLE